MASPPLASLVAARAAWDHERTGAREARAATSDPCPTRRDERFVSRALYLSLSFLGVLSVFALDTAVSRGEDRWTGVMWVVFAVTVTMHGAASADTAGFVPRSVWEVLKARGAAFALSLASVAGVGSAGASAVTASVGGNAGAHRAGAAAAAPGSVSANGARSQPLSATVSADAEEDCCDIDCGVLPYDNNDEDAVADASPTRRLFGCCRRGSKSSSVVTKLNDGTAELGDAAAVAAATAAAAARFNSLISNFHDRAASVNSSARSVNSNGNDDCEHGGPGADSAPAALQLLAPCLPPALRPHVLAHSALRRQLCDLYAVWATPALHVDTVLCYAPFMAKVHWPAAAPAPAVTQQQQPNRQQQTSDVSNAVAGTGG